MDISLKVLIISGSGAGGGNGRSKAYTKFLASKGFTVDTIHFPGDDLSLKVWYYYQSGLSLFIDREKRKMKKIAEKLETRIKERHYDAVIGVETWCSYVLTKKLDCLKIFSCESLMADEYYFSKRYDMETISNLRQMELEILQNADYTVFPWKTTENYVRKYIWNGSNLLTIKYGCYPQNKLAAYFFPLSIISLGSVDSYWGNPRLLSHLNQVSPYVIDFYAKNKPDKEYNLNYKGYASSLDVLRNYQFGLNLISKDAFRRNHHSSRILSYLAYGLPVLSPDWLQFSHDLKGVLPFNEDNFLDIIDNNSDPDKWAKVSKEAYEQAIELDWNKVLLPLQKLIAK